MFLEAATPTRAGESPTARRPRAGAGPAGPAARAGGALRLPVRDGDDLALCAAQGPLRRPRLIRRDRRGLGAGAGPGRALGGAEPGQVGPRPGRRAGRGQPARRRVPPGPGPRDRGAPAGRATPPSSRHPGVRAGRGRDLEPFYEAGRPSKAGSPRRRGPAAQGPVVPQLRGPDAFLLPAALASNLLNWWTRRELLPGSGLPHLGLAPTVGRVLAMPARVVRAPDGRLLLLLPPPAPLRPPPGPRRPRLAAAPAPRGGRLTPRRCAFPTLAMGDRGDRCIRGVSRTRPHGAPPCPPPAVPGASRPVGPRGGGGPGAAGPWILAGSPRGRVGTEHQPIRGRVGTEHPPIRAARGHRAPPDSGRLTLAPPGIFLSRRATSSAMWITSTGRPEACSAPRRCAMHPGCR